MTGERHIGEESKGTTKKPKEGGQQFKHCIQNAKGKARGKGAKKRDSLTEKNFGVKNLKPTRHKKSFSGKEQKIRERGGRE